MSLKFADNSIKVDSIVTLGSWPQRKKDGSVRPIEWQVLEVKDDHALLLSKYVLELRPYHNANAGIPWDQCELRTWLNNEFLSKAFNKEAFSFLYTPEASDEPKDRVFLLGYKDIERFFPRDGIMFKGSAAEPTQYVQECWRQEDAIDDSSGNVIWWLRSTVPALSMANIVSPVNSVGLSLISPDNRNGVRPAIRIRLNQKRGFISRLFRRKSGHKTESRSEYNIILPWKSSASVLSSSNQAFRKEQKQNSNVWRLKRKAEMQRHRRHWDFVSFMEKWFSKTMNRLSNGQKRQPKPVVPPRSLTLLTNT